MQYDYLDGNKNILSADGKKAHIKMVRSINKDVLIELGRKGYLKGQALEDYKKWQEKINTNTLQE